MTNERNADYIYIYLNFNINVLPKVVNNSN